MNKMELLIKSGIVFENRGGYSLSNLKRLDSKIAESGIDFSKYETTSSTRAEMIYRFLNDDLAEKTCIICGKLVKFISASKGWRTACSNSCSSKHMANQELSPITKGGWFHSEASKIKMRTNRVDISGDNNPLRKKIKEKPELSLKLSEKAINRWASYSNEKLTTIRENFSKAQSNSKLKNEPHYHRKNKSGHYKSSKMLKQMFYRSSYELSVCEFLDSSEKVKSWQIEPYSIEYTNKDNFTRYTRVDFEVKTSNSTYVIEVKPLGLLQWGNNPEKIKGIKEYCRRSGKTFLLITENELLDLNGVIL